MSKKIVFIMFISLLTSIYAEEPIRWDLQVTDPQFDLVNYKLENTVFKPYLKKTSWRCEVSEIEKKGKLEMRYLSCDYSIEKAGTVRTAISCSPERKYGETFLELFDERKNLTFKVMLTCNMPATP